MGKKVRIFLFSDALGWEIVQHYRFMCQELPYRYKVRTQLVYSSTAVPTILSGEPPTVHKHFSFFFLDKNGKSPFGLFRYFHWFMHPAKLFNNHRIRHKVSKFLNKFFKFTGYFNIYQVPYSRLPLFDYCEKDDIFAPGGLKYVPNLCDMLKDSGVKFHISNWRNSDQTNLDEAVKLLNDGEMEFLFIYTAGLDGMLHFHVHEPDYVQQKLNAFAAEVKKLLTAAQENYTDWNLSLFSDHGMTPLSGTADLKTPVENCPYKFGKDYVAAYDSTMMRLWFLNPACKADLMNAVNGQPGHWLTAAELEKYHVNFVDKQYGDEIFLMDPGIQIVPCDMGSKGIPGMHGYSPDDKDSEASFLTVQPPPEIPQDIAGFFALMKQAAFEIKEI